MQGPLNQNGEMERSITSWRKTSSRASNQKRRGDSSLFPVPARPKVYISPALTELRGHINL